jgi:outer membrane protein assembly factor BamB
VDASLYLINPTEGTMVTALNAADGSTRWRAQLAVASDPITSVAAEGSIVYLVTTDGTVSALDAASGALRWCAQAPQLVRATTAGPRPLLAVAQGVVYVTQHGRFNAVTALNASNGRQRWQTTLGGDSFYLFGALQVDAGLVMVTMLQLGTTNGTVTPTSHLVALSASDGSTRWSFQSQEGEFGPALTLANGTAYVVEDFGGECTETDIDAVNEQDGTLLWQVHDRDSCGYVWPVSASGLVFFSYIGRGSSPNVYALDGATGARRWVAVGSGPVADAGMVYVVTGSGNGPPQVQALQASSGAALWNWPGSDDLLDVLAAANGVVYVSNGTSLVALSSAGQQQWQASNLAAPGIRLTLGL